MAYIITQHRRGTYDEWLELDLVPYDGELVIVEFDNNLCKCKIGDGETPFSGLPYITDWLADDLTNKIDALRTLTGDELASAKADIYAIIEELSNAVESRFNDLGASISTRVDTISSDIENLKSDLEKVDGVVKTLVEPAVGELDAKYSEELSRIAEQHAADMFALSASVDKKHAELDDKTEALIKSATTKIKTSVDNVKTSVAADCAYKIIETEDRLRSSITAAEQALRQQSKTISKLQTDIDDIVTDITHVVDDKVADSESRINARIKETLDKIQQINDTISIKLDDYEVASYSSKPATYSLRSTAGSDTDISELVEQLEDLQYKVNTLDSGATSTNSKIREINSELSGLAKSVSNLSTTQKSNYNNLLNALGSLEAQLTKANSETNVLVTGHIADITNEINKLNATDTKLYTIMYGIEDKLINKIEAADALIQAELDDDVAKLTQSITDTATRLDARVSKTQSDLVDGLAEVSSNLTKKINAIGTSVENRINSNETALASLRASVSATNAVTTNELETLAADVLGNKTNITSIRSAISQVSNAVDTKTDVIKASVEALSSRVDSQISETEARVTAKIDAVDQRMSTQEQTMRVMQNDVNDLLIGLDSKITEKVLDNKADTDASILEIREDIHKINLTLIQLGANSGGSGSESDISSSELQLLVEQLATLQAKVTSLEKTSTTSTSDIATVNTELANLAKSISSVVDVQKAATDALTKSITEVDTRVSAANDALSSTTTNTLAEIRSEIADLAADDVILYQVIYKIRDDLIKGIDTSKADVLVGVDAIDERLSDVQSKLENDLSEVNDALVEKIDIAKAEAKNRSNQLETLIFSKANTNAKSISDLANTVKSNAIDFDKEIKTLTADTVSNKTGITANKVAINQVSSALNSTTKIVQDDIKLLDTRLDAQEARIGEIVAFTPTGAYDSSKEYLAEAVAREVVDARLGHESVANAITATNNDIQTLRNSLSQFIDNKAISGLHYDVKGEVGLGVPYYLYLKAGEEIIQDSGVQIIGGAGGGGSSSGGVGTIKINYITPQDYRVTPGADAKIYFTFSGEDSSGDVISSASSTWRVDGLVVERGTVYSGENYFDATEYIKEGTIKVHLTVTDDNGGSATKSWSVQLINLKIESEFDDKKYYNVSDEIIVDFVPTGAVDKYAKFILDGDDTLIEPMLLDSTKSGTTEYCSLPKLSHGAHRLEIYLEAEISGGTVKSTSRVIKDIICIDNLNTMPVIGTVTKELNVKQYSSTNIVYTVYDPNSDVPSVDIILDGVTVSAGYLVEPNKDYGNTPTAVYTYVATTAGQHEIKIVCGAAEKKISIFVEDLGLGGGITPVTTGLAFDFNPAGRTNGDANRLWSHNGVNLTVSDNFDWTNGGYLPNDPDGPCFCVKAGSTAVIDHKLFGTEAKDTGKEFKLIFKTKNVANPDAIFLSCIDSKTSAARVGIEMGVHNANIYGKSGNLELAYSEEDVIEFEYNISKYSSSDGALNMVMGYEDGVPSRPMIYDETYSFKQQGTPKSITIGSPDCDVYIYRFKVYNISLSNTDILKNFIADARTAEEMVNRYRRNRIYDENNKLTAESLAKACPWLRVIKVSAPKFTSSKKDDIPNTTIQQIYGQGRVSDNWVAYNAVHSGQGTSSDDYGAAGRNIDLKVRVIEDKNGNPINANPYFLLSDDSVVDKVSLTDKSIPVDYFNIKVNIASSNNLTNAIIANHYNKFNPYKRPYVREDSSIIEYIKDTMEFYNCVVFIQETDPDISTHREFADTDWHFYAIGNIGDSKKTDNTRVTDPSDPYECCVEIMDVGLPLSAFPRDTMTAGHFIEKKDDGSEVANITWSKNENIGLLYEKIDENTYIKSLDDEIDSNKEYYIYSNGEPIKASAEQRKKENLCILYEREYTLTADRVLDFNKTYYIDVDGVKTNAMEYIIEDQRKYTWAKDENLGILYEFSGYVRTDDIEVNQNKTYYVDVDGEKVVATEEQLNGTNPHESGLFERTYELTQDTTVDYEKTYYVKLEEKDSDGNIVNVVFSDAMGYITEQVKVYRYATKENLDAGLLYEVTYFKTADTEVADPSVKTYYVDILENDDFSEDYTYGWRYLAKKKDADVVAACKQAWIDFYRFVTTSTDDEFKTNLKDYFVVNSALYYYLFTTRYCMVDNRAKNTFWHYSKTADGSRKWDLCWDYDNDTSLGLNNFGKQVYRYGLEDIDYDGAGEEVFRQSDSLFFCRIRDLFDNELKSMYQTLESKGAWTASAFINKCDEWQAQFPEDLWRIDIERKYIRTYTKSFVDGKGDEQFLRDMANGRMKYHRRQWERGQEQYMASKYQTTVALGDAHHAHFRVGRPSGDNLAIAPNYQFTLTPYSHIYLNVKYGGATPVSVRAKPGIATPVPYSTKSADIINVGSAAAISDFGDLSAMYPKTVSVQNATRVKKLKLGNNTTGYSNPIFQRLTTGSNDLLKELDITNVTSYIGALDLTKLINLNKLLAFGTGLSSVSFADGGKLSYAELPAVNNITLKRLKYLTSSNLKVFENNYNNVVDLIVEGCPSINQLQLLESCVNIQRVRLDNVHFGTKEYDYFVDNIFKLTGLTATGANTDNAQLTGSVTIENLTGAQFNELRQHRYPNLTVAYNTLTSTIVFKDSDLETTIDTQTIINIANCQDPVKDFGKDAPTKAEDQEFTYELFGWSENKNILVDYNDMSESDAAAAEAEDKKKYNDDVLTDIEGDRTFYPVFKAKRKTYNVYFRNPSSSGDITLQVVVTPYGKDAVYTGNTPVKQDSVNASLYEHIGWEPKPENITGEFTCWAQFAPPDQNKFNQYGETDLDDNDILPGYTIGWSDLKDYPKYNTSTREYDYIDGYSINETGRTLTIRGCSNKFNPVIRIPDKLVDNASGKTYTITTIEGYNTGEGGFSGNTALKIVYLPNTLTNILANAFKGCTNLAELTLPENLAYIGSDAFSGCTRLSKILIPASVISISDSALSNSKLSDIAVSDENTSYYVDNGCLIERGTGRLIQGVAGAEIPNSVQSLGTYCFAGIDILTANVPYGVTDISSNAFNGCTKLTSVELPTTMRIIDATSFNNCTSLANVNLPEGLLQIKTYAFNNCALTDVTIPSTVKELLQNAFGNNTRLKEVTFAANIDEAGNVIMPEIAIDAFYGSGPVTFNLPWSEEQHYSKFSNNLTFGAKAGSTLNFDVKA